jgi:DNA-binding NarL/FixJ family response regulator
MKSVRILLADDHTLLVEAIKGLLEPEFEVAGVFPDGRALIDAVCDLNPDLVVMDISMPMLNGLDAGRRLKQMRPAVKIIYLTMNDDPDLAAEAFRLGASGYVLKTCASSELVLAIREALRGRCYVTPLVTKGMVGSFIQNAMRKKHPHSLTLRQREVLQLLAEGRSMKEVASMLEITPRTVAFHKYTMMEQLQIKTSAELVHYAARNSIVCG